MEKLIRKFAAKLADQGLCRQGEALIGGLDAELTWNRDAPETAVLEKLFRDLNINSILFARPAEPLDSIMNYLAGARETDTSAIYPEDCETRTFIHDIPVCFDFSAEAIVQRLKKRKSVFIPGKGVVTFGIVSPEQAFITFSSVCFAGFVKFFADCRYALNRGEKLDGRRRRILFDAMDAYDRFLSSISRKPLMQGPFPDKETVIAAMAQAGRMTVASRMVDSFFGNISCRFRDSILISQTASSLDELEGYIDDCPWDNSRSTAITASSEYTAHRSIFELRDAATILHGHPKFSVIMSMICDDLDCDRRGRCHVECDRERSVGEIPIVPGEVGTGPTGLCHTLPPAMTGKGVIVYGHGLFTVGQTDFRDAYQHLVDIEKMCFNKYREGIEHG